MAQFHKLVFANMRPSVLIVLALLTLSGCAGGPAPQAVRVFDREVELRRAGGGAMTVVFQSGLGDDSEVWGGLMGRLDGVARLVAVSRPGYGGSAPVAGPRDACRIADEQRETLRAAGIAPPYVLVGHSLGGLYQFAFAKRYPQDTAALVLIDPTHPSHWMSLQTEAPAMATVIKGARLLFRPAMAREFDDQEKCLGTLDPAEPVSVPTRLIVRGEFAPLERGDFERMVRRLQMDWQRMTRAPAVEPIRSSGHYVFRDQPDAVAAIIRETVNAVVAAPARAPAMR